MGGSDKDGIRANTIHVDAHSGFQVVHMDVPIFCDQVDDAVLGSDLTDGRDAFQLYSFQHLF